VGDGALTAVAAGKMSAGRKMLPILLVAAALVAGGVAWRLVATRRYHLATVQDAVLYRDGLRSRDQLAATVGRTGVKTIVSLLDDEERDREPYDCEEEWCRTNGVKLIRIPIRLGGWPSEEQVRQFLAVVADPNRRPVLVHCAQGVRRTGMMVAAYQETVMKFSRDQAKAALLAFGHSQRTIRDVQRFIDLYDPDAQRMTQELPISSE
jgi:protein tyrosine/serine phosphatase